MDELGRKDAGGQSILRTRARGVWSGGGRTGSRRVEENGVVKVVSERSRPTTEATGAIAHGPLVSTIPVRRNPDAVHELAAAKGGGTKRV